MSDETPQPKSAELLAKLEPREQRFVLFYCGVSALNGADAARRAGYSKKTARQIASENLSKPDIRAAVDAILTEQLMPKTEVLARLAAQAAGDMGDFVRVDEEEVTLTWSIYKQRPDKAGLPDEAAARIDLMLAQEQVKPTDLVLATAVVKRASARLDLLAAGEAGKLGLVKKYTVDKEGKISIELYDAQAALVKLGEAHGIFRDRIADNLDTIATAARSLDQKLMVDVGPGPTDGVPEAPERAGEGGPAA